MYCGDRDPKRNIRWEERDHILIGGRAIYNSSPDYGVVSHEMGHIIDREDRYVSLPGYGFKFGKYVPIGRGWYEMNTCRAFQREAIVSAIQAVVLDHWGFGFDFVKMAKSFEPFHWYDPWRNLMGYSYEDTNGIRTIHNVEGEAQKKRMSQTKPIAPLIDASLIKSLAETMSIQDIWTEWVRKHKVVERQIKGRIRRLRNSFAPKKEGSDGQ